MVKQLFSQRYRYKINFDCLAFVRSLLRAQFHILTVKTEQKPHDPANKINYSSTLEMEKARKNCYCIRSEEVDEVLHCELHIIILITGLFFFKDMQDSIFLIITFK